jgi:two-component system phosphate regulon sensor histidine kinase PhoR
MLSFLMIFRFYNREKEFTRQIKYFVNNMAHEFKTPLTYISFATNMVAKNELVKQDPKLISFTQIIKAEQSKLNERLENVLSSFERSRIEAIEMNPVNLQTIVHAVGNIYEDQVKVKEGNLKIVTQGDNFECYCQEDLIHIILSNLVENSIKYSGEHPDITITLNATATVFSLEVADKGIGIQKKYQGRIFEQYYRVPNGDIHDSKGFGIGLFHVKLIADQLDGNIKVISSPNKGSRFVVEWPRKVRK